MYGLGFGWQLGVGVATFVMSASVYLMVVVAAATGEPVLAMAIVTMFGLLRGLAVLPAARVRTPTDLAELHRRIERFRPASRVIAIAGQIAVLALAMTVLVGPVAGLITVEMISAIAAVGSAADVAAAIEKFEETGAEVMLVPVTAGDEGGSRTLRELA